MIRSIRWRLQAWFALVLLVVVGGFAGWLHYRERQAREQEVDQQLVDAARYLDVCLRRFPPHELDPSAPKQKGPPGKDAEGKKDKRPPPPMRERLLDELTLPRELDFGGEARLYFAVWRPTGSVVKAVAFPEGVDPPELESGQQTPGPRLVTRGDNREAILVGPMRTRILVGKSLVRQTADLHAHAWQLTATAAAVLVVGLAGCWLVSARIFRPLGVIARTASAISATQLTERIDPATVDAELVDLAQVLNAMLERLESAFERQTRFTADASHELRTPLAILRSHAELALARPRTPDEYREALDACFRAGQRMTELVESLLLLARADADKLELQRRPLDLAAVVGECLTLLRPLAEARQVTLTATLAPAQVVGDAGRLAQVVSNLVSNAVQYNRPGGRVEVTLRTVDGRAELGVADTGIGIAREAQPRVFERFFRADPARNRAFGGQGLGLAICRSILEAHGGTITFQSQPGEGTTFTVTLPLAPTPPD